VLHVASGVLPDVELVRGKIIAMEAAEPGNDWLFTCGIAGLITRFGGMGSHVAVRCAAFGVPAAIGCGGDIFNAIVASAEAFIDGASRQVWPVRSGE
jgi:phosphoenolpyruvate-protein kinase (PTS system EI component)